MSKKQFKSQASSSRAVSGAFGTTDGAFGGGAFGAVPGSMLSYIYEPPDLSAISESNIVVAFKSLQKKDSTTKAKALEELQSYISSLSAKKDAVDDEILDAWIKIYPRTSIDSARRVRQLAHLVQGNVAFSCGKRVAKHLPTVVGPWLAGLYDIDKNVTRATQESLAQVFPSDEKRKNLWRLYRSSIIAFCRDSITKETVHTLSDERTTSPDDAFAKHARVVGASALVVTNLLENYSPETVDEHDDAFDEFLKESKVWDLASHSDAFVRRAVYRLLVASLHRMKGSLDMKIISVRLLASSLHTDQTGSALDYATALSLLTECCPEVWTRYYSGSGKKTAMRRLQQFLKKGSQGGPPDLWDRIGSIIHNIPREVFTAQPDDGASEKEAPVAAQPQLAILEAMLFALRSKDEPSRNLGIAWTTYLKVFERMMLLANENHRSQLFKDFVLPIVPQYVKPSQEGPAWLPAKGHTYQLSICARAFLLVWSEEEEILHDRWTALSQEIVQDIKISRPEQSRDYVKSQSSLLEETSRWFDLEERIMKEDNSESIKALFKDTSSSVLKAAIESIRSRNGKPSGATATLVIAFQFTPELIHGNAELKSMIVQFVQKDCPNLLLSPSAPYIFTLLDLSHGMLDISRPYQAGLQILKETPNSPEKSRALTSLLSSPFLAKASGIDSLQLLLGDTLTSALDGDEGNWDLVQAAICNPQAPTGMIDSLLETMAESLEIEEKILGGLKGLSITEKVKGDALKTFSTSPSGTKLLSRLLTLAESRDEGVSGKAKSLSTTIKGFMSGEEGSNMATEPIIGIIKQGLATPTASSLPIESVVEQARKLYEETAEIEKPGLIARLLPSAAQWAEASSLLLRTVPSLALAITNPLGTAMEFLNRSRPAAGVLSESVPRDSDGFSTALRLVWFTTRLIQLTDILLHFSEDGKVNACIGIALLLQLATDNMSVPMQNGLWNATSSEVEASIVDFIADAQGLLVSWLQEKHQFVAIVQEQLLEDCQLSASASYYSARAYSGITIGIAELHGYAWAHRSEDLGQVVRKPSEPEHFFKAMAILSSAPESNQLTKLANEFLADLTGHDFGKQQESGHQKLLYLNGISYGHQDIVAEVPKPRLVFFVKSLVTALGNLPSMSIRAEIMRALNTILPYIKETYNDFWSEILTELPKTWSTSSIKSDESIPLIHTSLRLLSTLRRLANEESNDDLVDSWKENEKATSDGLLGLLQLSQNIPDESHQPRKMTNELLLRQLDKSPPTSISAESDLYSVMASEALALQQSAYNILHDHIPKQQEQISLDKALAKDKPYIAKLPEELLSLILAPPDEDALAEMSFERSMPATLRSYLLSWKLVYDHWTNTSYAVQEDYAKTLKEGTYLNHLLELASKFLIIDRTRPVDASKFDLKHYSPTEWDSPEADTHFLLSHLYTLSLICLPNLSQTWWRDSASRQTKIAVESWTEKYVSPLIISSELTTVSGWGPSQSTADQPLDIKVSHTTHEITASIPVDEQTMSIAIRLPPSYPLARATVESIHRVGVSESKWRSWLITTQGVINFSSEGNGGSLIEGLLAWRKNVTATLKGQTECAICYSVVSAERQLPSKRCGTCRNMFHGGCLYRWFRSSNSSSCPLCRNAFNYSQIGG